jgi:hypothetical protein
MDYSPKEFEHMRAIDKRMEELGHQIEHVPQFPYKSAVGLENLLKNQNNLGVGWLRRQKTEMLGKSAATCCIRLG